MEAKIFADMKEQFNPYVRWTEVKRTASQEAYCMGCSQAKACNVILKDGEICSDRWEERPK